MLTTTAPPAAVPTRIVADPSKIAADPVHLVLLAVVALAIVGFLLYRRSRHNNPTGHADAYQPEEGRDDRHGHHH